MVAVMMLVKQQQQLKSEGKSDSSPGGLGQALRGPRTPLLETAARDSPPANPAKVLPQTCAPPGWTQCPQGPQGRRRLAVRGEAPPRPRPLPARLERRPRPLAPGGSCGRTGRAPRSLPRYLLPRAEPERDARPGPGALPLQRGRSREDRGRPAVAAWAPQGTSSPRYRGAGAAGPACAHPGRARRGRGGGGGGRACACARACARLSVSGCDGG